MKHYFFKKMNVLFQSLNGSQVTSRRDSVSEIGSSTFDRFLYYYFFLQFGKKLLRSHSTKVRCAWKTSPSRSVQSWTLHGVNRKKGIEVLRRTVGLAVNRWPVYCCSQRRRESCNSSESARAEREREREVGDIFSEIQRQGCSCPSVVWEIAEAPSEPRFAQFSSCACCLSFPAAALERSCILFVFF